MEKRSNGWAALCHFSRRSRRRATAPSWWSSFLLVAVGAPAACNDPSSKNQDPIEQISSGGSGGLNEQTSGGQGGGMNPPCSDFDPSVSSCGACTQTLDEYCDEPDKCVLMGELTCIDDVSTQHVEKGCGFVKTTWWGDVGDQGVAIWKLGTSDMGGASSGPFGELVYLWQNGEGAIECRPERIVGEEPECDQWMSVCEDGMGGAGGNEHL